MNKRLLAHLALFGANLIYGINYTVAKDVMPDYIEPLGFILVRVTGAVIMFWLCYVLFYYEKVKANDLLKLAICGLFGVAINQMLFFEGLNLTTPINAAVIMASNPILVLLFGVFFATEGFSTKKEQKLQVACILVHFFRLTFLYKYNKLYDRVHSIFEF